MSTDPVLIANDHLTATIADLGAELQSLDLPDGRPLLWHGDPAFWAGRAPVLFPIVGRAPGDRIAVHGQTAPMAQHGFARRSRFTLTAADARSCRHELAASAETRAIYPCEFRLAITHALDGARLTIRAEVTNEGQTPMPFGFGFHPAFLWPLPGAAGRVHRVVLDNGASPALARLEGGFLPEQRHPSPFDGGVLPLDPAQFVTDAMIFPEGAGSGLTYGAEGGPALQFRFENLPHLALWSKPGAPFVCIEPWHGMAARCGGPPDIAARPGSILLAAGASARFACQITLAGGGSGAA